MDFRPLTSKKKVSSRWRSDFPVLGQLHLLVGMLTLFLFVEFLTLLLTLDMLSAVRVFERSERFWSQGVTHAVHHLRNYALAGNPADYRQFLLHMKTPLAYARAQRALDQQVLNVELAKRAFLEQGTHPADARKIIRYYRFFRNDHYIKTATALWREGNDLISKLFQVGVRLHGRFASPNPRPTTASNDIGEIDVLSSQLMALEDRFSQTLGEGGIWLERMITWLLLSVVFFGLFTAAIFTLSIRSTLSRGLRELATAARSLGDGDFEIDLRLPTDAEFEATAEALHSASQSLAKNISQREEAEKALREANEALESKVRARTAELAKANRLATEAIRARDEFISIASHELKTPLTCLKLQLALTATTLKRELAPKALQEKFEAALLTCQQQVERLAELSGQLLDVSQIQSGKMSLAPRQICLNSLVGDVLQRMSGEIAAAGSRVALDFQGEINGFWDQSKIDQVLVNLLSNALKYAPGSPIRIQARKIGDRAELTVKDHGPGIAAEYQLRIFDRFDRAGEKHGGGLGLGLYIVKRIVEEHGGTVEVKSRPGEGSSFTVKLPLHLHPAAQAAETATWGFPVG